jgi:iron-sulfur cluster repair protein YtfE (RIC family)
MADLKPIGSEKLQGQDKIKRIMEIARFNEVIPTNINETSRSEYSINLVDGNQYQIVKEKMGYIIKKNINESDVDYIEPMKNRKYYSSYSQALKRLNLLTKEVNRINENEEGTSLFGEQKKFTLKLPKPAPAPEAEVPAAPPAAPPAVPSPELPPSPDMGAEMGADMGAEMGADMGAEMGGEDMNVDMNAEMGGEDVNVDVNDEMGGGKEEQVTFKTIQKLTGKLTQKIRVLDNEEGMTSENIKYVINMVLSSLELNNLTEEDKEDILSKFEEDTENLEGDDMGGEDFTDDTEVEDIQADMDVPVEGGEDMTGMEPGNGAIMDSIFKESKVDKVISKYFEVTKQEIRESAERRAEKQLRIKSKVKKSMNSVVKMTETIEQELAAKKFLEENYNYTFIGKTNKKNLVFENKGQQKKISPEGLVL